jgi:hypothetical protein
VTFNAGYEAYAASIVFKAGIVQSLRGR